VHATDVPFNARDFAAVPKHVKSGGLPLGREAFCCGAAEKYPLTPAALGQHARQAVFAAIDNNPAGAGHRAHQVVELAFDRRQVVEDVGVVELQVVQDGGARAVMHELAALVEEGGVVLVGFDHEGTALPQPSRHAEVQRYAADQKAWLQAGALQNPGQHGRRGGFAVGARDSQHMARAGGVVRRVVQHMAGQPLGTAGVRHAGIEDGFHQGEFGFAAGVMRAGHHMTLCPASRASAARPPMKVPQIPRICMCMQVF